MQEPKFLDFEVRNEVQLIVLAESRGHRAYSKVSVFIKDVNDHPPCFGQSIYQVSVSEGQFYNDHIIQVTEMCCVWGSVNYILNLSLAYTIFDALYGTLG